MCLAIANYDGLLPFTHFENAASANADGMGLLWTDGKKLHSLKQLTNVRSFYDQYEAIRHQTAHPVLIHFRYGTHGKATRTNCHPFYVRPNLGFIHNGIFNEMPTDKHMSDTQMFNVTVLQQLPKDFLKSAGCLHLLEHYCHYEGSKLVFLDAAGNVEIINEAAGHWSESNWYSNHGYEPVAQRYKTSLFNAKWWEDYDARKDTSGKGSYLTSAELALLSDLSDDEN